MAGMLLGATAQGIPGDERLQQLQNLALGEIGVVGQTSNRLLDPTALLPAMINVDCLIHGVLQCVCGLGWIWTMIKREQIRARFDIPGTPLNDYCVSFWCQCCAIIQHDNEMATRMPKPLDLLKKQPLPLPEMSMPGTST
ncbi:hypothetical protein FHL15_007677 [Xylaria flabelliformis]|uniref:PLAC8 family protein n=1 Tax=Xylaria flabelliformis TaxID=2512241 RepID=A0A553HU17_9PEZI|nr:hypothetical protein FHL15_007677 [Xylaria flabelliformis]